MNGTMTGKGTNEEVFANLTEAGYIDDASGGVSTTLSAAAAKGATTITLTAATGALAGDMIRIGSGNQLEEAVILSIASMVATLETPTARAHPIGTAVVERKKVVTGEVSEQGVSRKSTSSRTAVKVATSTLVYKYLLLGMDHSLEWMTVNHNLENIAAGAGMPEAAITSGTGVRRLVLDGSGYLSVQNRSLYFIGARADGTVVEIQAWDVDMDPGSDATYQTGKESPVKLSGNARSIVVIERAP
jgi:hypothetical protein